MKTQILKTIRLMTFTLVLSFVTMHVFGNQTQTRYIGEGDKEECEQVQNEAQEKHQLEAWMTDKDFWKINNSKNTKTNDYTVETEEKQLECWMLNFNNFRTKEQIETDIIKKWMLNADYWNV